MTNPYQTPEYTSAEVEIFASPSSCKRSLTRFLWAYPLLLICAFYATWLAAWLSLGHPPRPSLDDPKSIGVAVDVPYYIAGLLLMGFPVALLAGIGLQLSMAQHRWRTRFLRSCLWILIWFATIAIMRWDPMAIAEWYMD